MRDLQGETAEIKIGIDHVGITDVVLPLKVYSKELGVQRVIASIDVLSSLDENGRGVHMSRMARVLNDYVGKTLSYKTLQSLLKDLQKKIENDFVLVKMRFPLFRKKYAPVTKNSSYVHYDCWIDGSINKNKSSFSIGVTAIITSLCPVSKSISEASAHNQRGEVTLSAEVIDSSVWFEDFISLIERNASCEMYGVLKREDEKYVTEKAYDNAKIVEDIVRSVAQELKLNKKIHAWSISCKNLESIHTHNAFAEIRGSNF